MVFLNSIISTLETLKKEAAEVTRKVEETDVVMAEVETTSQQYSALAQSCSSIYFTMEALNLVGLDYQNSEFIYRKIMMAKWVKRKFYYI